LQGWAPATILDAYQAERWPITEQVSRFAMAHAEREIARRGSVPAGIEDATDAGARLRAAAGSRAREINKPQYCAAGLNFGSYYDRSPLIAYDGEAPPPYTMGTFTSSTVPGCRLPHVWLADGRSLYDALGPAYTLLRRDASIDVAALRAAAAHRGCPLDLLELSDTPLPDAYRHALLIVRPDQHVAWRADHPPEESLALIDRLRGAVSPASP
jgi:hypothetical protein